MCMLCYMITLVIFEGHICHWHCLSDFCLSCDWMWSTSTHTVHLWLLCFRPYLMSYATCWIRGSLPLLLRKERQVSLCLSVCKVLKDLLQLELMFVNLVTWDMDYPLLHLCILFRWLQFVWRLYILLMLWCVNRIFKYALLWQDRVRPRRAPSMHIIVKRKVGSRLLSVLILLELVHLISWSRMPLKLKFHFMEGTFFPALHFDLLLYADS